MLTYLFSFRPSIFKAAIFVSLGVFVVSDLLFRFGLFAYIPQDFLVRDYRDDYIASYHRIAQSNQNAGERKLFIFGGSGINEGIPSPQVMQNMIDERELGVAVYHSANSYRSIAQDLAVLETIEDGTGTLIYALNISRYYYPESQLIKQVRGSQAIGTNRFFIREGGLKQFESCDVQCLITKFISSHTYLPSGTNYLMKLTESVVSGKWKIRYVQSRQPTIDENDYEKIAARKSTQMARWMKDRILNGRPRREEYFLNLLGKFIKEANRKGFDVIIVNQPMDYHTIKDSFKDILKRNNDNLTQLTKSVGSAYYENYFPNGELTFADFNDIAHLNNDKSRRIYFSWLLDVFEDRKRSQ